MRKIHIDDHTQRGNDIQLEQLEIVIDDSKPDRVELYILDQVGTRIEGGTFDKAALMSVIMDFYNSNY